MAQPQISVVVVAWRRDEDLPSCLDAVLQQTLARDQYEVIVVDNGGNPNTRRDYARRVDQWCDTGSNLGCSGGRNYGVERCAADVVAFVDDDGVVRPDFLEIALRVFAGAAFVVGVRGRVLAKRHPVLTMMSGLYTLGPRPMERVALDCEGCSAVRRAEFQAVGGFDVRLAGGEGLDWTVRVMQRFPGLTVAYEPNLVMRHDYVDSVRRFLSKAHMNRKSRERAEQRLAQFPTLRPPEGTFQFDIMPDMRPWPQRLVSMVGEFALRVASHLPEIKDDVRK